MISVVTPALIENLEQLATSYACIQAAKERTKVNFELIVVETGSTYLQAFSDVHIFEKHKTNATKSINRGFQMCRSDFVVLLTNDVIVGEHWLESLLECFLIPDCGLATLASTQFGHERQDKIEEGIWFSVAMMPRARAQFDENYVNSWDDSDLVMQTYLTGQKMYRSFKSIAHHKPGMTQYQKPDHALNFERNRAYFIDKWKAHSNHPMFQLLTVGHIV